MTVICWMLTNPSLYFTTYFCTLLIRLCFPPGLHSCVTAYEGQKVNEISWHYYAFSSFQDISFWITNINLFITKQIWVKLNECLWKIYRQSTWNFWTKVLDQPTLPFQEPQKNLIQLDLRFKWKSAWSHFHFPGHQMWTNMFLQCKLIRDNRSNHTTLCTLQKPFDPRGVEDQESKT